jgi:hypothetical protein
LSAREGPVFRFGLPGGGGLKAASPEAGKNLLIKKTKILDSWKLIANIGP